MSVRVEWRKSLGDDITLEKFVVFDVGYEFCGFYSLKVKCDIIVLRNWHYIVFKKW